MGLKVKRIYDQPGPADGERFLVDRLWPRGLKKEEARLQAWLKELAPSPELRLWFAHDPRRWGEFQQRYVKELEDPEKAPHLKALLDRAFKGTVTLVFAARDTERNNAVVLKHYLEQRLGAAPQRR